MRQTLEIILRGIQHIHIYMCGVVGTTNSFLRLLTFSALFFVYVLFWSAHTAEAAYPYVAGTNSGNSAANTTQTTITLPTNYIPGDLLIVMFVKDGTAAPTSVSGSGGWTAFGGAAGTADYFQAYWKIATKISNDSLYINHASEGSAYVAYAIRGHASTAPEAGTLATGTSVNPNSPNLGPTNWDVEDTLWISAYGWDGNISHTSYPSDYTEGQTTSRWASVDGVGMARTPFPVHVTDGNRGAF